MAVDLYALNPIETGLLENGIIQIFGEITDDTLDYVQKCISISEAQWSPQGLPPILVKINSGGGSFYHSLMIYDLIRLYSGLSTGIVIGGAMSGANVILQACKIRAASRGSLLHVHNMLSTFSLDIMRDKKAYKEEFKQMEEEQRMLYSIYNKRTGKKVSELRELFKKGKPFSPKKALELNFIDKIV